MVMAAGALMTEATSKWPAASGTVAPSTLA